MATLGKEAHTYVLEGLKAVTSFLKGHSTCCHKHTRMRDKHSRSLQT